MTEWELFEPELPKIDLEFYKMSLEDLKEHSSVCCDGHIPSFDTKEDEEAWKEQFRAKQKSLMPELTNFVCTINESQRDAEPIQENSERVFLDPNEPNPDASTRVILRRGIQLHLEKVVKLLWEGPQKFYHFQN